MSYIHQDHLGSTSVITDESGDAVYEASYDPWGNVRASTGTPDIDRLYTGQRFDAVTGLYYYNARSCDPTLARVLSPDTVVPGVGDPQAWNRYAYVLGNPMRYVDPSGNHHLEDELSEARRRWMSLINGPGPEQRGAYEAYDALRWQSRDDHSFFAKLAREENLVQLLNDPAKVAATEEFLGTSVSDPGTVIYDGVTKQVILVRNGTLTTYAMNGTSSTFKLHSVSWLPGGVAGITLSSEDVVIKRSANLGIIVHEAVHVKQAAELPFGLGRHPEVWISYALMNPGIEDQAYVASWGHPDPRSATRTITHFNVFNR